jgi:hypothetical protein
MIPIEDARKLEAARARRERKAEARQAQRDAEMARKVAAQVSAGVGI